MALRRGVNMGAKKVTSNIYMVGGDISVPGDAAVYLITDGAKAALVDTGTGKGISAIARNITGTGTALSSIELIFLTHCHFDHTGGALSMREKTQAKTVMHKLDAVYVTEGDSETTAASWYGSMMKKTPVDIIIEKDKETSQWVIWKSQHCTHPDIPRDQLY